jgi:hypothetical protein
VEGAVQDYPPQKSMGVFADIQSPIAADLCFG